MARATATEAAATKVTNSKMVALWPWPVFPGLVVWGRFPFFFPLVSHDVAALLFFILKTSA
jgi:hypothetical protein